jgi:hypothetical protein
MVRDGRLRLAALLWWAGPFNQPMPRSSDISSGVPQVRQITAEQSPQVSGSSTSRAQLGQYNSGECAEPLVGDSGV